MRSRHLNVELLSGPVCPVTQTALDLTCCPSLSSTPGVVFRVKHLNAEVIARGCEDRVLDGPASRSFLPLEPFPPEAGPSRTRSSQGGGAKLGGERGTYRSGRSVTVKTLNPKP